jgi:hypothetical protein
MVFSAQLAEGKDDCPCPPPYTLSTPSTRVMLSTPSSPQQDYRDIATCTQIRSIALLPLIFGDNYITIGSLLVTGSRDLAENYILQRKIPFMYSQKRNSRRLSPNFHIHVSVNDLYIPRISPHIFLQKNRQTRPIVEIGTEALQTLFWEYWFRIFGIVSLQCSRQRKNPKVAFSCSVVCTSADGSWGWGGAGGYIGM